jgi:hypothetical protein
MGQLTFQATLGGAVNLVGPNTVATTSFTLPAADGTSGQTLQTNGSGTLSFAATSLTSGVTGTLPIANGGTGTTSTTFANLTTNVTGTLPVANGGTGAATLAANNVILGNGTSAVQVVAPSTNGNILTSNGTTWVSQAPSASGALAAKTCTFNASGTWTKPSGYGCTARVFIQAWGGGGSGIKCSCGAGGGGGGGYNYRWMSIACLASTVTVTVGAGGTATSGRTGVTGGTSSFGSHISAYGGGRSRCSTGYSGGGGGALSAGSCGARAGAPNGGVPFYVGASGAWVVYEGTGGFSNGSQNISAVSGYYKGGGGGGNTCAIRDGAGSVWGGGGGGGTVGASQGTGGTSSFGGNGGGGRTCCSGVSGTQPGGGGGGTLTGSVSGAGGAGRVVVTVYAGV